MINITIKRAGEYWIRVEGHAGYDEKGKDIVCAAVSGAINGFVALCDEKAASKDIELIKCVYEDGKVEVLAKDYGSGHLKGAYQLLEKTLYLIADAYKDYVIMDAEVLPSYILFSR